LSLWRIAAIGDIRDALTAGLIDDKNIINIARITATPTPASDILYTIVISKSSPIYLLAIITSTYPAKRPLSIPATIPAAPKAAASYSTFLLICLGVAPIEANIPYCFVFSVIDIEKLLLMHTADVTIIITITTSAILYTKAMLELVRLLDSYLISQSFK